jgi:hypothetical protein
VLSAGLGAAPLAHDVGSHLGALQATKQQPGVSQSRTAVRWPGPEPAVPESWLTGHPRTPLTPGPGTPCSGRTAAQAHPAPAEMVTHEHSALHSAAIPAAAGLADVQAQKGLPQMAATWVRRRLAVRSMMSGTQLRVTLLENPS